MNDGERQAVYRVAFEGPDLERAEISALRAKSAVWEGSSCDASGLCQHTARLWAHGPTEAIATARQILDAKGGFAGYHSRAVTDSEGQPWRASIDQTWREIDWSTPPRAGLAGLQRSVLGALLDDHEPLWIIMTDPDVAASSAAVEGALAELERQGLVDSRMAASGEPRHEADTVSWWAITEKGWDLLGVIASPRYR
jgi:hypothetical protein